jgi:hypothetical protein
MNQVYTIVLMLTLVGFVLTAQTAKAWPNNMIRYTYMPSVPVNPNASPGSDGSEHAIDIHCENEFHRVWNATHNSTMSDNTRSKCFDHLEEYEATKYPNEYSYQNRYSSGGGNFESCGDSDTWTWGGSCVNAMHPAQYGDGCGPDNTNIYNKTACLDGYRDGWKKWCKMNADSCNDLAKQGIIPDSVRNQTLVDLQTNINETSDDSPKAPPGAVENIMTWNWKTGNGTSIIKNSTGTYQGPPVIIHNANSTSNLTGPSTNQSNADYSYAALCPKHSNNIIPHTFYNISDSIYSVKVVRIVS